MFAVIPSKQAQANKNFVFTIATAILLCILLVACVMTSSTYVNANDIIPNNTNANCCEMDKIDALIKKPKTWTFERNLSYNKCK